MVFSVIIPTYNSVRYIERCLSSIFTQRPPQTEIIIVDNGSTDATPDFVEEWYPEVKVIRNKKNMGSSYARNQGAAASRGEYLIFMDSNACLKDDFFSILDGALRRLPSRICGVSPKILHAGSNMVFSCGLSISPIYRVYDIGSRRDTAIFTDPFPIDGPNSCCAIFKRGPLDSVSPDGKYFDEDFFFLFEDADLALRLRERGYQSLFLPELIAHHYKNGSSTPSEFGRYLCLRNRLYMIIKSKDKNDLPKFFLKSLFYDIPRTLHFAVTNRYFPRLIKEIKSKYEKSHHL